MQRQNEAKDGSFKIVYLTDGRTPFALELTWPFARLGSPATIWAITRCTVFPRVPAEQYEEIWAYHREMGWILL